MSFVKNPILLPLQKLVGISPTPQPVVLDDTNISLTMPLVPDITRRSRTHGPTGGMYSGILRNVHAGADDESSTIDPYAPGADAVAPYPTSVDEGFDVWLLGLCGQMSQGSGDLITAGFASISVPDHMQGFGREDDGTPLALSPSFNVALFTGIDGTGSGNPPLTLAGSGQVWIELGIRLARGQRITWKTTSSAAADFDLQMLIGLFPAGLGQDIVT